MIPTIDVTKQKGLKLTLEQGRKNIYGNSKSYTIKSGDFEENDTTSFEKHLQMAQGYNVYSTNSGMLSMSANQWKAYNENTDLINDVFKRTAAVQNAAGASAQTVTQSVESDRNDIETKTVYGKVDGNKLYLLFDQKGKAGHGYPVRSVKNERIFLWSDKEWQIIKDKQQQRIDYYLCDKLLVYATEKSLHEITEQEGLGYTVIVFTNDYSSGQPLRQDNPHWRFFGLGKPKVEGKNDNKFTLEYKVFKDA